MHVGLSGCRKIKKTRRVLEKALLRPDGTESADVVCDLVRAMFVANSMGQIARVVGALAELHRQKVIIIVRIKDRFFTQTSAGGWRDVMVNFYATSDVCKHVCEVRPWPCRSRSDPFLPQPVTPTPLTSTSPPTTATSLTQIPPPPLARPS